MALVHHNFRRRRIRLIPATISSVLAIRFRSRLATTRPEPVREFRYISLAERYTLSTTAGQSPVCRQSGGKQDHLENRLLIFEVAESGIRHIRFWSRRSSRTSAHALNCQMESRFGIQGCGMLRASTSSSSRTPNAAVLPSSPWLGWFEATPLVMRMRVAPSAPTAACAADRGFR